MVQTWGPDDFRAVVRQLFQRRVEIFAASGEDWRFAASLKAISEDTAQEYEGRAVLELLQNAHDALSDREPGAAAVVLDLATEPGVLYVANEGLPFTERNFRAISELALSDKVAGEGIGNKGLGFRSVLQLTDAPEVFSRSPDRPAAGELDGFCFRFATPRDIDDLVPDAALAARVKNEVSSLALPVPAFPDDSRLKEFVEAGYSTVVRLPLRDSYARAEAERQIRALNDPDRPLLLFLDRFERVSAVVETEDHRAEEEFTRHLAEVNQDSAAASVARVVLTPGGDYFVAEATLAEEQFRAAIRGSVERREIDKGWLDYRGQATVAAAVRVDEPIEEGYFYTYLPMGAEARAPARAHLHGPFFTKLARLAKSEEIGLNSFLLDALADLCLGFAEALKTVVDNDVAALLVDLVAWRTPDHQRIVDAAARKGRPIEDIQFVPLEGAKRWGTLRACRMWTPHPENKVFIAAAVVRRGVELVDTSMSDTRRSALEDFRTAVLGESASPHPEELAGWAEAVATEARPTRSMSAWGAFYDDLKRSFASRGEALRGRRIVLDDKGEVQPALGGSARRSRALFFSPSPDEVAEGASVRASVPAALRRRIVFTHPDIPWLAPGTPPRRRQGRLFLEETGLVRDYRSDRVLDALRDLLRDTTSDALRRDALFFVFKLYPSITDQQRSGLHELGLSVPLKRGGWSTARESILAPAWGTAASTVLGRLLVSLKDEPARSHVEDRLVLDPSDWPFDIDDVEAFREFLVRIGVADGLPPRQGLSSMGERLGNDLYPSHLARELGLPEDLAASWQSDLSAKWSSGNHPYTRYALNSPLSVPALASAERELDADTREALSELVTAGLSTWPDHFFDVLVYRRGRPIGQQDRHDWPTPLKSYLQHEAWLPVHVGSGGLTTVEFRRPREVWVSQLGEMPTFVPALPSRLREAISHPMTMKRLRDAGLRIWEDPADAPQLLRDLGEMLERGEVAEHFFVNFEKHYRRAWSDVIATGTTVDLAGASVAVRRGRSLQSVAVGGDEGLFVADEDNPATELLLEQMDRPVLVTEPRDGEAAATLLEAVGSRTTRMSAVRVDVYCDDVLVVPDPNAPRLVSPDNPWVAVVVALVAELRGGIVRRSERGLRQLLDRIQALRIVRGRGLHFVLDDEEATVPGLRAVGVDDEAAPTIVLEEQDSFIEELEAAATAIAQLIGQPTLGQHLELAFIKLGRQLSSGRSPNEDSTLANALSASPERVAELRLALRGGVHQLIMNVRVGIAALVGTAKIDAFDQACVGVTDEGGVAGAITSTAPQLPISARDLIEHARPPASLDVLRDALGVSFREFNAVLLALGPPYEPLRYPERHDRAFATFVDSRRDVLLDRLREAYLDDFRSGKVLDAYLAGRDLSGLEPDPNWLDEFAEPPEEAMATHVMQWLGSNGARPDLDGPCVLDPIDVTRADNFHRLQTLVTRAERIVLTWCHKRETSPPDAWNSPQVVLRANLEQSGIADFEGLPDERILAMVIAAGWPADMPRTLDLDALGLSEGDLRSRDELEAAARKRARQRSKTIRLNDRDIPVTVDDYSTIAAAAVEALTESFLAQRGRAHLAPIEASKRPRRSRGGHVVVARDAALSEDQARAVGLVGEVFAKAWLERRHPNARVEWRSGFRSIVLGDEGGSDSLGYDFEVVRKGSTLLYEVKSTAGEPKAGVLQFSLTESELDQAQANARNDRYRLLLVLGVLAPGETTVLELPNPRAAASRGLYAVVGSGLTYQCAPGG